MKFLFSFFLLLLTASGSWAGEKPTVLVSIAPYKFFVDKIAGDTVEVLLMVPAGASAHTYEPTPKEIVATSHAELWFIIGETFEKRALAALQAHNRDLVAIDLRKGVEMISADPHSGHCCCNAACQDLHIWLSARQAMTQARTIADALSRRYPHYSMRYQEALKDFLINLEVLDREITKILQPLKQRTILVSHPAYAYFCKDYDLTQLSIEVEGKEPTAQQMTRLLQAARAAGIKRVYVQPQYSSKGAKLFAHELRAEVIVLNPYSEHYLSMMKTLAEQFAKN